MKLLLILSLFALFSSFYCGDDEYNYFMNQILVETEISTKDYEEFLKKYPDYGYEGRIDDIVKKDLSRTKGETYLDYTGSGVYRDSQLEKYFKELSTSFYGNSHSLNPSSIRTTHMV